MTSRRIPRLDVVAEEDALHEELEALDGIELLTFEETDEGYVKVVLRQTCEEGCADCPHGPYVYHVEPEPNMSDGVHLHWTFIGETAHD